MCKSYNAFYRFQFKLNITFSFDNSASKIDSNMSSTIDVKQFFKRLKKMYNAWAV